MKKTSTLILAVMLMLAHYTLSAQCTINTGNTTPGFTPTSLPCAAQGVAYGQADNIYVPASYNSGTVTLTVDSVQLISTTGMPAGITVSGNPASGIIHGGGNGCLWFSGTTSAAVGTYTLTSRIRVWAELFGSQLAPIDTTMAGLGYNFSMTVCAASTVVASVTSSGSDSICSGSSVTLTANSGSGYTYKWSDATHSTTQAITATTAGTYHVTVYSGTDSAVSSSVAVVVRTAPSAALSASGTATFCQGDSVILSAPQLTGDSYQWSGSTNTTHSLKVTATGTYQVTVTDSHGCSATSSTAVTVNPLPTDVITASGTLLSSQVQSSYQWYFNGSPISGATSQTYTATQNGIYSVGATNANGCSAMSNSISLSVGTGGLTASILSSSSSDSVCPGGAVTLMANFGSVYTYKWNDAAHSTTESIVVLASGSFQVTVYSGTDSAVSSAVAVFVRTNPSVLVTASGPTSFCAGDSVILSVPQGSGDTYQWSNSFNTTNTITAYSSGTYSVFVTDPYGCTAGSVNTQVTVNPGPTDVITLSGLVLTSQTESSYQWYMNGSSVSGATSQTFTANQNGVYSVNATANGCSAMSNSITISNVGINDISGTVSGISIYPNPNTGSFILMSANSSGKEFAITDMLGRVVAQQPISSDKMNVEVKNLAAGSYMLKVKDNTSDAIRFTISK